MATLAVVKDLEVFKHRVSELKASAPSLSVEQLDLHPTPGNPGRTTPFFGRMEANGSTKAVNVRARIRTSLSARAEGAGDQDGRRGHQADRPAPRSYHPDFGAARYRVGDASLVVHTSRDWPRRQARRHNGRHGAQVDDVPKLATETTETQHVFQPANGSV